ncbi:3-oxo-tetronate kinase [Jiangella asiatica]|uniref:3-oxo-tetronate kinase n=1 Tax=Jiangella asiatica TaxID=2530372 RepID=A0A4R5DKX1_9ACTN|nr:3-oxo-tetronate kinase [Jiangella asiatica]TDE12670.1 four-carbon acid sugar kinase family protein [Jiangella asiatica]
MTWLGVVADDVTGACDLAGVVGSTGVPATVLLGPPRAGDEPAPGAGCTVVALTSRTAPVDDAVAWSVAAGRWLLDHGARRLYQKYCSTFDSTKAGNIGPVADALADLTGGVSAGTPATPAVGRTVYQGHLFVDGRLLSESPLRDHPLTPMTDPDLVRVLGAQTPRPVALVPWPSFGGRTERDAADAVRRRVRDDPTGHVLLDALTDADLDLHSAALFKGDELLGGASGLAAALARRHVKLAGSAAAATSLPDVGRAGGRVVLAGSCSRRTREQIAAFPGPSVWIAVDDLATDQERAVTAAVAAVAAALRSGDGRPVLVTTSLDPGELRRVQDRHGRDRSAQLAEDALAAVASAVVDTGVRRLIVAGGETSGAVTAALGVRQVLVGDQVAPGVPWTVSVGPTRLALLLKAGNFGPPDLFSTAWAVAP